MDQKWQVADIILGLIIGVLGTITGMLKWVGSKLADLSDKHEARIDAMHNEINPAHIHERITSNANDITQLRARQEDDRRRLESIDNKLAVIDDKLDSKLEKVISLIIHKPN